LPVDSKSVTTSNTWQTAIDLSTITDFNRLHGDFPIRILDGSFRIEFYRQVPFEKRERPLLSKTNPVRASLYTSVVRL
jgi:hypothetical protein